MRWKFLTVLLLILMASFRPFTARAAPAAAAPTTYLALGDSLAIGVGATVPMHTGYVPHLFNYFHGTAHGGVTSLVDLGQGGVGSSMFIQNGQLHDAIQVIQDPTKSVRVVTLDIGGDDLLPLLSGPCRPDPTASVCIAAVQTALISFAQNYPLILGSLRQALAAVQGGQLLVMDYYNPFSGTDGLGPSYAAFDDATKLALEGADGVVDCRADAANPTLVGLNDLIVCGAEAAGVPVADVYSLFLGRGATLTHILTGDIHPNDAGYAAIARAFEAAQRGAR